jgi:hypothetical protein
VKGHIVQPLPVLQILLNLLMAMLFQRGPPFQRTLQLYSMAQSNDALAAFPLTLDCRRLPKKMPPMVFLKDCRQRVVKAAARQNFEMISEAKSDARNPAHVVTLNRSTPRGNYGNLWFEIH